MCLSFSSTMSTTEGGRKVSAAVASTGRAVASTSRAVGGALSHARGALSGWWSALTTPAPPSDAPSDTPSLTSESEDNDGEVGEAKEAGEVGDNRTQPDADADPPDKLIEDDTLTNLSKIRVI